jgi:uroporphyrinogen decarboxylase
MKPRERVSLALSHRESDRCPLQLSFTPEFAERLGQSLGLDSGVYNPHGGGNTCILEEGSPAAICC